jgi:hypothetical protein
MYCMLPSSMVHYSARRAASYRVGDTIQYRKANKEVGVRAKEYATVLAKDVDRNRITVETQSGRVVTYLKRGYSNGFHFAKGNCSMAIGNSFVFRSSNSVADSHVGAPRDRFFIVHMQRVRRQEAHAAAMRLHLFTLVKQAGESFVDGSCVRVETAEYVQTARA